MSVLFGLVYFHSSAEVFHGLTCCRCMKCIARVDTTDRKADTMPRRWFGRFLRQPNQDLDDERTKICGTDNFTQHYNEDLFSGFQRPSSSDTDLYSVKLVNRKTTIITFVLSLSVASGISLVAIFATGMHHNSPDDRMNQLSALVLKTVALGNFDQAQAMLNAAQSVSVDSEELSHVRSLKSFVSISGAIRKVDRWRSAGKLDMAEKLIAELLKLDIPREDIDLRKAIELRGLKIKLKRQLAVAEQGADLRPTPSVLAPKLGFPVIE